MSLELFMMMEFDDLVGEIIDFDELQFILDSIYAEYIDVDDFVRDYGVTPSFKSIIKLLNDPLTRENLIQYGERAYNNAYRAEVGDREYTGTKAYYDGISDPDEVEYGDGYPVVIDDFHNPDIYKTPFGIHITR